MINEAKAQAPITTAPDNTAVGKLLVGGRPVESDHTCRMFRVVVHAPNLVYDGVLNESYGRYPEPPEEFTGKRFRSLSRSHLRDFIENATHASDEYPGTLMHFQIVSEMHVVDLITTAHPSVSILESSHQKLAALGGTQPYLQVPPRRRAM